MVKPKECWNTSVVLTALKLNSWERTDKNSSLLSAMLGENSSSNRCQEFPGGHIQVYKLFRRLSNVFAYSLCVIKIRLFKTQAIFKVLNVHFCDRHTYYNWVFTAFFSPFSFSYLPVIIVYWWAKKRVREGIKKTLIHIEKERGLWVG